MSKSNLIKKREKWLFWFLLLTLAALFAFIVISLNDETSQKTPELPNNDNPTDNPRPKPFPQPMPLPTDTENWWLTDEEIEHAYQEIRKEIVNHPEIQLVSPSVVRVIQEGGEISEDLKQAKIIFFPINNSENHETSNSGSHWTLLVYFQKDKDFYLYDSLKGFNERYYRQQTNERKLAEKTRKALYGKERHTIIEDEEHNVQQKNNSDCGVFVIAYTRTLIKRFRDKGDIVDEEGTMGVKEKDLIFTIAEERQKLKETGFPKKGTRGKDYKIGDDVEYLEKEERHILEWWDKAATTVLQRHVKMVWLSTLNQQELTKASDFKEFSKKVRLLSGVNKLEKEKLSQIYQIKKILKACSLSLEEYKKAKSFNGKDNFREDKITTEERQFVRKNIKKETVKEINDLYHFHFPEE